MPLRANSDAASSPYSAARAPSNARSSSAVARGRPAILKLNFRNPDHRHDLGLYRCERADERLGRWPANVALSHAEQCSGVRAGLPGS